MRTPWDAIRDRLTRYVYVPAASNLSINVAGMTAEELYRTQPHLQTVISFRSRNLAQLPLKCYVRDADGGRKRDRTSDAALVMRRPNESQTMYEFVDDLSRRLDVYDICFTVIAPSLKTPSGWSWTILPNDWVKVPKGNDPFQLDHVQVRTKRGDYVDIDEGLVVFHGWNPSEPRLGLTPIESLKTILEEQIEANEFRRSVWRNGGRFSEYITRPKDVKRWDDKDITRFREQFAQSWAKGGERAGGVPVLEDGMEVKSMQFNAKEAQWLETAKLSLDTCSWVYGIKPGMITGEGQTYASVKENARALYNDVLGPRIIFIQQRINEVLLPIIGADPDEYVEFDLQAKLMGSFEEQAAILSTSTGAPWMLRSEARERMNLPHVEGTDELVVPLNVLEGGLASPRDTGSNDGTEVQRVMLLNDGPERAKHTCRKSRGHPDDSDVGAYEACLRSFLKRQKASVLARLGAKSDGEWWDAERWDAELADDLYPLLLDSSSESARQGLKRLQVEGEYSVDRTKAYVRKMAEGRASAFNAVTRKRLAECLDGDFDDEAEMSDPEGVFDVAMDARSTLSGKALAAAAWGFGLMEGMRQLADVNKLTKTWIHTPSKSPRSDHEALDGETVEFDAPFSNGAQFPGDNALGAEDWAYCHCEIEITRW